MTILQLEYVIACMQQQSINKAAASLMVSPSNLSKMLLALEAELGYPIFVRGQKGLRPTLRGELFLQHAQTIMNELRQIDRLDKKDLVLRLYVVGVPFSPINEAFEKILLDNQDREAFHMRLDICRSEEAITRLEAAHDHVAIISVSVQKEASLLSYLKSRKISGITLLRTPMCINLRSGHPALDTLSESTEAFINELQRYPYLNYESTFDESFGIAGDDLKSRLLYKCTRLVNVSDRGWKNRLLRTTECFTFGIHSMYYSSDSAITSIETPFEQIAILAAYVNRGKIQPLAERYISLLKQVIGERRSLAERHAD